MKIAYLVIAHDDSYLFSKLIDLLDDSRNDIFVQIDKKADITNFNDVITEYSNLFFLEKRVDIRWGSFSQVEVELSLLREAKSHGDYDYYILLSGVDLPIKRQDEIHSFFYHNKGKEFVGFAQFPSDLEYKTQYRHICLRNWKNKNEFIRLFCRVMRRGFIHFQEMIGYRRKFDIELKKGCNWFCVSNRFVTYLLSKEEYIRKNFKYVWCPDEIFLQSIIWNSPFRSNIYDFDDEFHGCMRLIDWNRGTPYVWQDDDYTEIMNSDRLFARKFSSSLNSSIINKIYGHLKK